HISPDAAVQEIDPGNAGVEMALHGVSTTTPSSPFFRFPYFDSTPAELDLLQSRRVAVFGAGFCASDWERMSPGEGRKRVNSRLEEIHKGILLLHDPQQRTVAMPPAFLRYLKDNDYHIVHIVPGSVTQSAQSPEPAPHGEGPKD